MPRGFRGQADTVLVPKAGTKMRHKSLRDLQFQYVTAIGIEDAEQLSGPVTFKSFSIHILIDHQVPSSTHTYSLINKLSPRKAIPLN
jgi:hypothetical protein